MILHCHKQRFLFVSPSDIDECVSPPVCGPESVCVNTDGSYRCDCLPGYRAAGPRRQCRGQRPFKENTTFSSHSKTKTHTFILSLAASNMLFSHLSLFLTNFSHYGTLSSAGSDVNECLEGDFCFPSGECVNTDGSFKCVCAHGYMSAVNGTSCQGMTPVVIYN